MIRPTPEQLAEWRARAEAGEVDFIRMRPLFVEIDHLETEVSETQQCLDMVKEALQAIGIDTTHVPPMNYREAILSSHAELQAQCAAMREALSQARKTIVKANSLEDRGPFPLDLDEAIRKSFDMIDALSSDAGKALLERLATAERIAKVTIGEFGSSYISHVVWEEFRSAMIAYHAARKETR